MNNEELKEVLFKAIEGRHKLIDWMMALFVGIDMFLIINGIIFLKGDIIKEDYEKFGWLFITMGILSLAQIGTVVINDKLIHRLASRIEEE